MMELVEPEVAVRGTQFDAPYNQPYSHGVPETGQLSVIGGMAILISVAIAFTSLATWNVADPSLSNANGQQATNWLGYWGASFSDIAIQFLGLGAAMALIPPAILSWLKILRVPVINYRRRLLAWPMSILLSSGAISCLGSPQSWPLPTGMGGIAGDLILKIPSMIFGSEPSGFLTFCLFIALGIPAGILCLYASGLLKNSDKQTISDLDDEENDAALAFGALAHWYYMLRSRFTHKKKHKPSSQIQVAETGQASRWATISNWISNSVRKLVTPEDEGLSTYSPATRQDPQMDGTLAGKMPGYGEQVYGAPDVNLADEFQNSSHIASGGFEPIGNSRADYDELGNPYSDPQLSDYQAASPAPANRVAPVAHKPEQGKQLNREAQKSLFSGDGFELPSLHFLSEPKNIIQDDTMGAEALEQNARLLEGVLADFGVKGEIINVRPGPVVTLYELEPAPGIKSSRVIGLADDIARSMSAIAARVAVIPGRNAIGIELPNSRRETVYLREILSSRDYINTKAKLALSLGKTIGGESVIADLAKMPHLLVAGTTGSGKSVAINTMILSILYRLSPAQVKMIMIDPKMLELSIYDGIPHLLTPVVTDPKKAVVALKWTVREMEERYKKMSKLGVRNIDGYNGRLAQAREKNEVITKTVQVGYDRDTGEAIYETEELDLEEIPYIIVVIDEMADLMMVAGKDIEGTVQRLAQMARAAGIHVIMATQRPSVDVITGTIKANFPTRISFQVTSKIDSRTILGEQGAEQLLGMGDMLYMAGGGRIQRVHGPFVGDDEVEQIVNHLKMQGVPQYLESVVEDIEEDNDNNGASPAGNMSASDDPYDQAVAIVLRDRKASTSYIQRRLSIGYNRAATLIERMEQEGLISPANHSGKREILVPDENETI